MPRSGVLSCFILVLELSPKNMGYLLHTSHILDQDSFMARAAQFFNPVINVKDDSDSDPETEATSKITEEDVIIKERKSLDKVNNFYSHFWSNCSIQEMLQMLLKLAVQHVESVIARNNATFFSV